jgi:methionyl-tRNA synthetase
MSKKFYITTTIPYVNAAPHVGHALEYVQTDVLARYHRKAGKDVFFLTGTDENSLKNVQAAKVEKISVQELVDRNSEIFKNLKQSLNLDFNDFIRTTEKRHTEGAKKFWQECQKDIYKKKYQGLYCVGCEMFYKESELENSLCSEHRTKLETIEEENYFFKLSNYQKQLEKIIESDELEIIPQSRKNETLAFIKAGLEDFSISRSAKRGDGWGVEVPNDNSQRMYVWFDALTNYITALGYGSDNLEKFERYWPADLHCLGKGVLRFHAIYWPAMLLSAGLSLPKKLFVH